MSGKVATPKPALTFVDAVAITIGIVIGAGIFETPSRVAASVNSEEVALLAWLLGGAISLVGALCYAELATAYPHAGGNYYYLQRAFGKNLSFLFAWARMMVIQPGSIALLAFVFGDYASQLLRLGNYSPSMYAAIAVASLTCLNIIGVHQGKSAQVWFTVTDVVGLLLVAVIGIAFTSNATLMMPKPTTPEALGSAMIFVLLSFGGWNEAAYISAELRNVRRDMARSLFWSIGIITGSYLLINWAFIHALGLASMAASEAVAADLMRRALGEPGAIFISLLITIATLGSINATIFTGARTNYALGQDFSLFAHLGHWRERTNTPTNALLVQAAIALALVLLGTLTRNGFETMVDYTAPVFWLFFLLSGVSLFVLRVREPEVPRPFRVPLYPLTPLLFCAICVYMLQSSIAYTGVGALVGVAVLVLGIPLLFVARRMHKPNHNSRRLK